MSNITKPTSLRVTVPGSLNEATRRMIVGFAEEIAGHIAYEEEKRRAPFIGMPPDPVRPDPEWVKKQLTTDVMHGARPLVVAAWAAFLWHLGEESVTPMRADPPEAPTETMGDPPQVTVTPMEGDQPEAKPDAPLALVYPERLNEGLRQALNLHPDDADKIVARLRLAQPDLPRNDEDNLPIALHFVIPFAIRHDERWREEARAALPPLPANHPRGHVLR